MLWPMRSTHRCIKAVYAALVGKGMTRPLPKCWPVSQPAMQLPPTSRHGVFSTSLDMRSSGSNSGCRALIPLGTQNFLLGAEHGQARGDALDQK